MGRRTERTAQTEADLRQAFWRLYADAPIEKITVGQVCLAAGYNRGTFYLHYRDLYDLLQGIEDELLDKTAACVGSCMRRLKADSGKLALIAACAEVVAFYERHKRYLSVLLGEGGDPLFTSRLKERMKPLWRLYVVGERFDLAEDEVELLLEYTLSGMLFMISRWLADPGQVSARQLAHLIYDLSIKDIKAR